MMNQKEQLAGIWKDVQENHKRLIGCEGPHDFIDQNPEKQLGK